MRLRLINTQLCISLCTLCVLLFSESYLHHRVSYSRDKQYGHYQHSLTTVSRSNLVEQSELFRSKGVWSSLRQFIAKLRKPYVAIMPDSYQYTLPQKLIVFVNRKSGGLLGKQLLNRLSETLDADCSCDLARDNPSQALMNMAMKSSNNTSKNLSMPNNRTLALCCGGDGTVRWIMDEGAKLNISSSLTYAVAPMGTGNDLFNHLISSYCSKEDSYEIVNVLSPNNIAYNTELALSLFDGAKNTVQLDRWQLQTIPIAANVKEIYEDKVKRDQVKIGKAFRKRRAFSKVFKMWVKRFRRGKPLETALIRGSTATCSQFNNYFGIGVDGAITVAYDNLRKRRPYLFVTRIFNKLLYGIVWIVKLIQGGTSALNEKLEFYCDGKIVELPDEIRGIIVCNINSYAGGSKLWQFRKSPWRPLSSNDGILEVSLVCF